MGYNLDNIIVNLKKEIQESCGGGGTSDYSQLTNKPQINEVTLSGNKSLSDLGIASASDLAAVEALIPESASTSNQLATASDIPDVVVGNPSGSASAGNLTKLQIGSDIYDVPSGSGGVSVTTTGRVLLNNLTWSASGGGLYYAVIPNVIPANKTLISAVIIDWNMLTANDWFMFGPSTSNPQNLLIMAHTGTFGDETSINVRLTYI